VLIAVLDQQAIYLFKHAQNGWSATAKLTNSGQFDETNSADKLQFDGDFLYSLSSTGVWRYDLSGL
jgi:hypothetical protein